MRERTTGGRNLTGRRLTLYPAAALLAVFVAFVYAVVSSDGPRIATGRLGGDYPAFYAAGTLVARGDSEQLYQSTAQLAAQEGTHFGEAEGNFLIFPYPPHFALLYVPFSWLPYKWSFVLHTAVMAALLAATARLLMPLLPRLGRYPFVLFAMLVIYYPMFRALVGGQNTPLTIFLLALVWRAMAQERQYLLGTSLAALLFKPHFSLVMSVLSGLRLSKGLVLSWLGVAAVTYALGAAVGGLDWISWWLGEVYRFQVTDQAVNASNSVGILGFLEAMFGPGSPPVVAAGLLLSTGLGLWLMILWWRREEPLNHRLAITFAAFPLVQPHALYYDGGIALLSLFILLDQKQGPGPFAITAVFCAAFLTPLSRYLGVNPLFFVLIAILVMSIMARRAWVLAQEDSRS